MNLIGGIAVLGLGVYITRNQIQTFRKKEQDELGWDIKLLGGGMGLMMIGIALIVKDF